MYIGCWLVTAEALLFSCGCLYGTSGGQSVTRKRVSEVNLGFITQFSVPVFHIHPAINREVGSGPINASNCTEIYSYSTPRMKNYPLLSCCFVC
jgi:hypothetical protein